MGPPKATVVACFHHLEETWLVNTAYTVSSISLCLVGWCVSQAAPKESAIYVILHFTWLRFPNPEKQYLLLYGFPLGH